MGKCMGRYNFMSDDFKSKINANPINERMQSILVFIIELMYVSGLVYRLYSVFTHLYLSTVAVNIEQ